MIIVRHQGIALDPPPIQDLEAGVLKGNYSVEFSLCIDSVFLLMKYLLFAQRRNVPQSWQ